MEGNMMKKLFAKKEAFFRSEDGATAIEYGLIAAGIAVAISVVVFTFGENLSTLFSDMADKVGGS
jgi:pilus assembly protein Flp/PilA